MVSYESTEKVLFSADGFGRFGAVAKFDEKADWASADVYKRQAGSVVRQHGGLQCPVAGLFCLMAQLGQQVIAKAMAPELLTHVCFRSSGRGNGWWCAGFRKPAWSWPCG